MYLKSIKGVNTELGILAHQDKMQLRDKGRNSDHYSFGVMPLFSLIFLNRIMASDRRALVPHAVLLYKFSSERVKVS